jgi:hypothetical protein
MKTKCVSSSDTALFQRLLAAGCPTPFHMEQESQRDLTIEVSRPEVTIAYDGRAGTEYVFGVRVRNHSYSSLVLQEFRGRPPWFGRLLWLGDPRIHMPEREVYRLGSGREFPCNQVLNHCVQERGALGPGASLEGVLLAYTMFHRIPFEFLQGETAPVSLFVVDQYGRKHRSEIEILVDRTATMRPLIRNPSRRSLFDEPKLDHSPTLFGRTPLPAANLTGDTSVTDNED